MHPHVSLLLDQQPSSSTGVVDFRSSNAFLSLHIRHSLHICGIEGLNSRFSWLPPPKSDSNAGKRLIIICVNADKELLMHSLSRWNVVAWVGEDEDNDFFWADATKEGLVAHGKEDDPSLLFEPSPLIDMAVRACEDSMVATTSATVLDLGCGAARDIAWIVRRESRLTWLATGLDNLLATVQRAKLLWYDMRLNKPAKSHIEDIVWAQSTQKGTLQALQLGPESKTKGIPVTPSQKGDGSTLLNFAAQNLPHTTYDLILLIRFLPRPLLCNIPDLSHPGTIIAISHFTTLEEEPDYPSPDSSKRFEESDMVTLLASWGQDWQLLSQVIHRAEDGRPIRSVLFRRQ